MPLSALRVTDDRETYVIALSPERLEEAPRVEADTLQQPDWAAAERPVLRARPELSRRRGAVFSTSMLCLLRARSQRKTKCSGIADTGLRRIYFETFLRQKG